ncbi:hypothetical protein D9M70_640590 [compost metagenome]
MANIGDLIEFFVRLADLDTAANNPDAPSWAKRHRKLIRVALVLLAIPAVPIAAALVWDLFGR